MAQNGGKVVSLFVLKVNIMISGQAILQHLSTKFNENPFQSWPYHASYNLLELWLKRPRKTNLGTLKMKIETSSETPGKPY